MTPLPDPQHDSSRRAFVTRAAYMAPAILTLAAAPSYAKAGSEKPVDSSTDSGTTPQAATVRHRRHRPRPTAPVGGGSSTPPV